MGKEGGNWGEIGGSLARCAQRANILSVNKGHHSGQVAMSALDSDSDSLLPTVFTVYCPFKCQRKGGGGWTQAGVCGHRLEYVDRGQSRWIEGVASFSRICITPFAAQAHNGGYLVKLSTRRGKTS